MKQIYLKEILNQMPRILSLQNRNKLSKTYGCFDRNYWQYQTKDISFTSLQEGTLTLALIYNTKNTIYFKNKKILEWIKAGIDFWQKLQKKDGSFDSVYPNEKSIVATAFSSYAISETLLKLNIRGNVIDNLIKACNWLKDKHEFRVQNQEAGTVIAFYNCYLLTKKEWLKEEAEKRIRRLEELQIEGWFLEYGGADIGYLTLTISYLANYYKKSKDKTAKRILNKAIDFLYENLGSIGTRNTKYLMPFGIEIMAGENKKARDIAGYIRTKTIYQEIPAPYCFDDQYLIHFSHDWLQAYNESKVYNTDEIITKEILSKENKGTVPITPLSKIFLNLFQLTLGRNNKISHFIKEKFRDLVVEAPSSRFFTKKELKDGEI